MSKKNLPVLLLVVLIISTLVLSLFHKPRNYQIPQKADYVQSRIVIKFKETKEIITKKGVNQHKDRFMIADIQSGLSSKTLRTLNEAGVTSLERVFKEAQFPQDRSFWQKMLNFFRLGEKIDPLANYFILNINLNLNIQDSINILLKTSDIKSAEPDYLMYTTLQPNDPLYPQLWAIPNIQTEDAWNISTGSNSITVAVVDSGTDLAHPDLVNNLVTGKNFIEPGTDPIDDFGHGTHVAGIIGAVGNNGVGVTGINWIIKIMPLRVAKKVFVLRNGQLVATAAGPTTAIANAFRYAADNGARVINLSMAISIPDSGMHDAVNYALNKGVVIVAAAGNDSLNQVYYPANYPGVIAVSATNQSDQFASFSNFGDKIDVSAPGVSIISTSIPGFTNVCTADGKYCAAAGTSMASPHVAGLAALILSKNPALTSGQVKNILTSSSDDLGPVGKDPQFGCGRINAKKALEMVQTNIIPTSICNPITPSPSPTDTPTPIDTPTPTPTVTPNPANTPTPTVIPTPTPTGSAHAPIIPTRTPTPSPTPILIYRCDTPTPAAAGPQLQLKSLNCQVITPTP